MLIVKDSIGRNLNFKNTPQRIVSLSPMITRLLCELFLENKLVGITNQCTQPYHLKSIKMSVGEKNSPILPKIEALQPDIIFCDNHSLSEEVIAELHQIAPVFVYQINSLQEANDFLQQIGNLLKCNTESTRFIQKLDFKLNDFKNFIKDKKSHKIAFFVAAWKSIGISPYLSEILKLNKFETIYTAEKEEDIIINKIRFQGDPKVILLATDRFEFTDEHAFEIGNYANRSATVFVESNPFCQFGVHTLKAFDYFKMIHKRLESHF